MTDEKPLVGTLYLAPNGEAWRLRSYGVDWQAEPFTGEKTEPVYSVANLNGSQSMGWHLPEGATVVWTPTVEVSAELTRHHS